LEDDSSPLDGQQEKTRAYRTPVVRQQEISNRHLAARSARSGLRSSAPSGNLNARQQYFRH
jgi:hypothetical protein